MMCGIVNQKKLKVNLSGRREMTIEDLMYYLQEYLTEEERKRYLQSLYYRKQMIEYGVLSKGQMIELKNKWSCNE